MPYRNNYWKSLIGDNTQVMIGGAVAYTSQSTAALFAANAVQGEMGVFDNDTGGLVSGSGAASVTENIYVAVKRDGNIERTVTFQIQNIKATRTAYSAPVLQISKVTFGASVAIQDITYVNQTTSPVTIVYVVAGNSTPLSVSVTGSAITVNLATTSGGAASSTATQVQAAIAASAAASALVAATVTGTGATVQAAQALTNIPGQPVITAGNIYELDLMELTPGFQPFPTWDYQYVAKTGDTIDTIANYFVGVINNTTLVDNQNRDRVANATYAAGVITITAIYYGSTFKVLPKFALQTAVTVTTPTPMHLGSGFTDQMELFQDAGDIFKGVTTNYPLQGTTPADFGKPADVVNQSVGYNIYMITGYTDSKSKTPHHRQWFFQNIMIGVPTSGTTPEAQIKNIFNL